MSGAEKRFILRLLGGIGRVLGLPEVGVREEDEVVEGVGEGGRAMHANWCKKVGRL